MPIGYAIALSMCGVALVGLAIHHLILRGVKQRRWKLWLKEELEELSYMAWMSFYTASTALVPITTGLMCNYSLSVGLPFWAVIVIAVCGGITTIGVAWVITKWSKDKVWRPKYSVSEKEILKDERLRFQTEHPKISGVITKAETIARKIRW